MPTHLLGVGGGRWSCSELACYVNSVCDTTHRLPCSIDTVEQVLDTFRQRFIADVDADAIVYELAHQGIISDADLEELTAMKGAKQKNQLLYRCLMKKNTKVSLLKVCSIMIEEEGNPKMKQFGRDLEQGRWCCTHVGEHRLHTDLTFV